jgi:CRISPR/Cas system-associated exonuclease Cas4 (RecB family)
MIDFNKMIDAYLKKEHRPKGMGRYFPSEIGICMRKTWYSYKYPQEIKAELLRVFEVGNIMHTFVVEVLKSEKNPDVELLKSEFPFKFDVDDFVISGRIDNLILVKISGKSVLVEVKSSANIDFVDDAMPHNIMQLQLYMHALQVHDGILLYIDKRNLNSKVFTIHYNEKAAAMVIDRFKALHKHLTEETLPDPEARGKKDMLWLCRLCEYRERCYGDTPKDSKWV